METLRHQLQLKESRLWQDVWNATGVCRPCQQLWCSREYKDLQRVFRNTLIFRLGSTLEIPPIGFSHFPENL